MMMTDEKVLYEFRDGNVFLKPVLDQEERQIGEVKESEDQTLEYFKGKFDAFVDKIDELKQKMDETENKGSFLMKVIHLREQLKTLNAIGDYEGVDLRLESYEKDLEVNIEENRHKNLTHKMIYLSELEALINEDTNSENTALIKDLQRKWVRIGRVPKDNEEDIEGRYTVLINQFFAQRSDFLDRKKLLTEARVTTYKSLIEDARKLLEDKKIDNNGEAFKLIQASWKDVGGVATAIMAPLWKEFSELGTIYFNELKKNRKKNSQGAKQGNNASLKRKEELYNLSKELYDLPLDEAIKKAKYLQDEWKNTGYVDKKKQKDIYEEFMLACDFVFEWLHLDKAVSRRIKGYESLSVEDQNKQKISFLKKLISRDKEELERFEDNKELVNVSTKSLFSKVMDSKFSGQQRKLEAKQKLLNKLSGR